jgi:hypothetical protein
MKPPTWLGKIGTAAAANSPSLLSAAGVAGVVTTAILASKATRQATLKTAEIQNRELTMPETKELVSLYWKLYIPTAVSGAATIACIIGANQIGLRRNAALLGAYTLADTAFREYKDEVLAQIGAAKERKVHDEVVKKQIDANPVGDKQVVITGGGDQLCYESLTGRYFKSDIETIRQAANMVHHSVLTNMYASLNEFFELLGLGTTALGEELGWNIDVIPEIIFTTHLADDGRPCLAVGFAHLPRKDYGQF